jgi:hypothetical protein
MSLNHKGRCSTVTFRCAACGKIRRGAPAMERKLYPAETQTYGATDAICWFCWEIIIPQQVAMMGD